MSRRFGGRDALLGETLEAPPDASPEALEPRHPWLTILYHPHLARIGDEAPLTALGRRGEVRLSRTEPEFEAPRGSDPWPLADPFLPRRPAILRAAGAGVEIERPTDEALPIFASGQPIEKSRVFTPAEIERGVILQLKNRVVLCLHYRRPRKERLPELGLVGESESLDDIRRRILQVADLSVPVLLLGETGSGKELVAQAIHTSSPRAKRPCLSVNMAAVAPSVAASELFGHVKGAFTSAVSDNQGFFVRADGSTLFMDEVGETPVDVQVMLLRALETGIVQAVGDATAKKVDVRLVAATDADLDALVKNGRFRAALLHRLSGYEIRIPPLRARRDDLGRLFHFFLKKELGEIGEAHRLEVNAEQDARPYLAAEIVRRFTEYDWPGNVRQLRNTVRQLVISNRGAPALKLDASIERMLSLAERVAATSVAAQSALIEEASERVEVPSKRKPSDVNEDELIAALKKNRWRLQPTAEDLRINRSSLYMLIDRSTKIRKASDVPAEEILAVYQEVSGDLDSMAERLEVSRRGLQLRLKDII